MKYELGPLETELIFSLEREGRNAFTVDDAQKILDASDEVVRVVLHRLASKGRVQRIKRGHYLLVPARAGYDTAWTEHVFAFMDHILDEYYIGYWTALNYWQMTEQIPQTIFVASKKRRRDFTYNDKVPIQFITLGQRKFFGWTREKIGDTSFRVSDREKTIIDSLDLLQYAGGISEVAKGLGHELDWTKIVAYADKLGNRTVHKRLGYLIETLEIETPAKILEHLRSSIGSGYPWLDNTAPKNAIQTDSTWRLKINVSPDSLRGI